MIVGWFGDMKDNNIIKDKKFNNYGFSLVEVIVSMTILVIVATILLAGVMTAGTIRSRSVDLTRAGFNQAAELEADADSFSGTGAETVQLSINSEDIQVTGDYISRLDDNTGVGFTMFMAQVASGSQTTEEFENTPTQAAIGGNTDYVFFAEDGISNYVFENQDGGGGAVIPENSVYYDLEGYLGGAGGYYITRYQQYLKYPLTQEEIYNYMYKSNGDPKYGVRINLSIDPENLPEPSEDTEYGDLWKEGTPPNLKLYVFSPESRYWHDYEAPFSDTNVWKPLPYYPVGS